DAVVGGAGPAWRAVVMGVERNRPARRRCKRRDDVVRSGAGNAPLLIQFVAGKLVAHDRFVADAFERRDYILADTVILSRIGGMRPEIAQSLSQLRFGALRTEPTGANVTPQRRRLFEQWCERHRAEQSNEEQRKPHALLAHF